MLYHVVHPIRIIISPELPTLEIPQGCSRLRTPLTPRWGRSRFNGSQRSAKEARMRSAWKAFDKLPRDKKTPLNCLAVLVQLAGELPSAEELEAQGFPYEDDVRKDARFVRGLLPC